MTDNTTLSDEINIMIDDRINQIPRPLLCKVTKIYDDNKHIDISTDNGDLTYIATIGNTPTVNKTGLLVFLDNNKHIVIL